MMEWPMVKVGYGEILHQDWRCVRVELLDVQTLKQAGVLEMEWDLPPATGYWLSVNGFEKVFYRKDTDCNEETKEILRQHGYELASGQEV